jgi:hypothetical protein
MYWICVGSAAAGENNKCGTSRQAASAIKLHTRQKMTAAALGAAGMLNLGKLNIHETLFIKFQQLLDISNNTNVSKHFYSKISPIWPFYCHFIVPH